MVRGILLGYTAYIFFDPTPSQGGWSDNNRIRYWARSTFPFKLIQEYFNAELVRTAELDCNRSYMFIYHPHGIVAMGCNTALTTEACDFSINFPGISRSTCTLNASFFVPFYREWMLANGIISANKKTIINHLCRGDSLVLVPGGATEALHAHPGVFRLYLKQRKGFIKIAIQTGCSVVPCLGFGENEIFHTVYDKNYASDHKERVGFLKAMFQFQTWLKGCLSFSTPIATHIFPRREKIVVVTGAPIHFDSVLDSVKCDDVGAVNDELIDKYHSLYCASVQKLYDDNKRKFGVDGVELLIM